MTAAPTPPPAPLPGAGGPVSGPVTVSMPYYRTPGTVRAAVEAVLGQTWRDLWLVVTNDGDHETPPWRALADITDPRLIRVEMPTNRGRYFADAVALAACGTPWFAIHDSDDAADRDWLAVLMEAAVTNGWDAAFAPQRVLDGATVVVEAVTRAFTATRRLRHLAHHAALYRTDALRAVGGPHPGFRIGYDSLMVGLMALNGTVGAVGRPLYTRQIRAGSLTTSRSTGKGSATRRMAIEAITDLYAQAQAHTPAIAVHGSVPAELKMAVATAVHAIRWQLCCGMHNRHCEAPADLCCSSCTEASHVGVFPHGDGTPCVLGTRRVNADERS